MATYHLAECNIGRLVAPLDSAPLAPFVEALDPVNELADATPGFVWRLQTEDGDATAIRPFDDEMMIINLSVWESVETLATYVYRLAAHRDIMRRRREFFEKPSEAFFVLWWIPAGSIPTVDEAKARLDLLRTSGPSPDAFTFRSPFPPPGSDPQADADALGGAASDDWFCPI